MKKIEFGEHLIWRWMTKLAKIAKCSARQNLYE